MKTKLDQKGQNRLDDGIGKLPEKVLKLLLGLHRRISLTVKMIIATVIFGTVMWYSFDIMQTKNLEGIFQASLSEDLRVRAEEDRHGFERYINRHLLFAKLHTSQKPFIEYVENKVWFQAENREIIYHKHRPAWLSGVPEMNMVANPRFALLLDDEGKIREVYRDRADEKLPSEVFYFSGDVAAKSEGRVIMITLNEKVFVAASVKHTAQGGGPGAVLMFVSPLDKIFLESAADLLPSGRILALLSTDGDPYVLASSNPDLIPAGLELEAFRSNYLMKGHEFSGYSVPEQVVRLFSFVPMEKVDSLVASILYSDQKLRIMGLPVIIISFVLFMFWITRRIQLLTLRISDFSKRTLGVEPSGLKRGDQLYALEERFQNLTDEVLAARDRLRKEAEEKLLLEMKHMEMEQKEKELVFLQSITQAIGIGVMVETADGKEAANQQMEVLAWLCGGLSNFDIDKAENEELVLEDRNGEKRIFNISSPAIFNEEKICLVRDITEIREEADALEHMAMHDSLTGLPNRALLQDRLQQAIFVGQREEKELALLMMDLDRFKEINDTLGHHVGDLVLKEVGKRLPGVLRKSDTFARLGGDEFAVVLPSTDAEHARNTALKLLKALEDPFVVDGHNLHVGASLGMVFFPEHGEDATTMLKRADVAMYVAKNNQSGMVVYNPEHDQHSIKNLVLVSELRHAIEREELELYYQPKVDIGTGGFKGVEALVRWNHIQHGYVGPDEFISLAEYTGLIKPMTSWVLRTAIHQYICWQQSGIGVGSVISVNLSSISLLDPDFSGEVESLITMYGLNPDCLELEITESAVMADPEQAMKTVKKLRAVGVRLSIDDFGTGYSSLAYLRRLPVNDIKIDKSFVMNMVSDKSDEMIVRSTIDLAHNLGLGVIAEGVDSVEIWNKLKEMKCDGAQGYYICVPLPAEELASWLEGMNMTSGEGIGSSVNKP